MTIDARDHHDLVHRYLLDRAATEGGNRSAVRFPLEDIEWSWTELRHHADQAARQLRELNVSKGDVVALLGQASSHYLRYLLGSLWLGAVVAPLNHAYRGSILAHVLRRSGARVLVIDDEVIDRLAAAELDGANLDVLGPASMGRGKVLPKSMTLRPTDSLVATTTAIEDPSIRYWDPYAIVFTSGTTGPSKGVISPYGQIEAVVRDNFLQWVTEDDVLMLDGPVFHISGLLMIYTALAAKAELVVYPKFSGSEFWHRVRQYDVTVATIVGPEILLQAPARSDDRDNPLRLVLTGRHSPEWRRRFGVERSFTFYNMSEISSPLQLPPVPANPLSVGLPRPGVELRIVDDHDIEVPPGDVGELIVRTDRPWEMNIGHANDAAATAAAWRNGWFHTGDAFRVDRDSGEYLFIDRMKDCVRRRGENISSYEVESELMAHPAVADCAVIAVPGDLPGDEEVKAVIVIETETDLDPADLVVFLEPRLPRFMIPRFIEFVDALPRTETAKVRKVALRAEGVNDRTWDRLAQQPERSA